MDAIVVDSTPQNISPDSLTGGRLFLLNFYICLLFFIGGFPDFNNLIFIPGETDQTEEEEETGVERESTAERELDLPTESIGKVILKWNVLSWIYFTEMDVIKSAEQETLHEVEVEGDEGDEAMNV